jgi:hypothetical protein
MNNLRVYYRRLFYRLQCRGSCLALPVFVSRARILVGTCVIIELSELTKKLLFLILSFFVSSQRNVQLHFLGSIRRPCLRAQYRLVFHAELSLPRGLKGGIAAYNDQNGHISNTSVICWILGSPQRVNFFFNMSKEEYIRVSRSLSHFDILNQFAYRNRVQKGFFPGNLTWLCWHNPQLICLPFYRLIDVMAL